MCVFFFGSRSLSPSLSSVAAAVAAALAARGRSAAVGCATGADAAVVAAWLSVPGAASRLSVFAAFGPGGRGRFGGSSVAGVQAAGAAGASVSWLAGGPRGVPLVSRLKARTRACCAAGSSAVGFFGSAHSPGSCFSARLALAADQPVWVFGVAPSPRSVSGVSWLPARLFGFPCWRSS